MHTKQLERRVLFVPLRVISWIVISFSVEYDATKGSKWWKLATS